MWANNWPTVRTSFVGWKDHISSGILSTEPRMSPLAMANMFFETVMSGFAGVSWADATAANKTTTVKSFIDVLSIEVWTIIAFFGTVPDARLRSRRVPPSTEIGLQLLLLRRRLDGGRVRIVDQFVEGGQIAGQQSVER